MYGWLNPWLDESIDTEPWVQGTNCILFFKIYIDSPAPRDPVQDLSLAQKAPS